MESCRCPSSLELKRRGQKLAMVTAYDFPSGRIADDAGVELVLVGDSAAMVVLGHDSTVPATMEELLMLTGAVTRGAKRPLVIADMPFGSYQVTDEAAVENAVRFVKEAGADAVKLEGAGPMLSRVQAIVGAGIPVMGHVGLTPQSATMLGGFKAQGRTAAKAERLYEDALALEAAGCFAIVLEAVPAAIAARVTEALKVPTIGIGAGAGCDGQVLVWHDLLGLYDGKAPRFVKRYADLAAEAKRALEAYVDDVREGRFPEEQHTYAIPEEELEEFEAWLGSRVSGDAVWGEAGGPRAQPMFRQALLAAVELAQPEDEQTDGPGDEGELDHARRPCCPRHDRSPRCGRRPRRRPQAGRARRRTAKERSEPRRTQARAAPGGGSYRRRRASPNAGADRLRSTRRCRRSRRR